MKIGLQTWGSEGDTRPFLHLATGLAQAGHEVGLVISEVAPRDYSEEARRGGFALEESAPPLFTDPVEMRRLGDRMMAASNPIAQAKLIVEHGFDPVAEQAANASTDLANWAEILVGHYFLPSVPAAAQAAGIPHVTVQLSHGFIPTRQEHPLGSGSFGALGNRIVWALAGWQTNRILLRRANHARQALGVPPVRDVLREAWISPQLTLVAVSRALCTPQPDWPASCRVTGFLNPPPLAGELSDDLARFLDEDAPPTFFTFGSLMPADQGAVDNTLRLWCEAARRADVSALLQSPLEPSFDLPDHVRIIRRCDHAAVFPRCAAIVHHGGAGTTQSAIRAGVPSVIVPHVADQFFWGATLKRLHLGRATRRRQRVSAAEIAAALTSIRRHPRTQTACGHAREIASKEDGVAAAVRHIEALTS